MSAEARLWRMGAAAEQLPLLQGDEAAVPISREAADGSALPSAGSSPHLSSQPLRAGTMRPRSHSLLRYSLLGLRNSSRKAPLKAIVRPPYMRSYRWDGGLVALTI